MPGSFKKPLSPLKVLSLSSVFPSPHEPNLGVFVRSRLRHMAAWMEIKVAAPIPLLDYSRLGEGNSAVRHFSRRYTDGDIEVFHPAWLYPPKGGVFNAACLFLSVMPIAIRIRREFAFDLIDAHFGYPEGIAAAMLALAMRCPFTVTLRGNETMHAGFTLRRLAMGWALRRAARVITVSGSLRQFAISLGVKPERVRTISNGIDTSVFYPRDRDRCRERLGVPAGCKLILSVGYLIERKGHHRIVQALSRLRTAGLDAVLWVIGGKGREGNFQDDLKNLVQKSGLGNAVRFIGPVPPSNLAEYMSAADVFCLASSREGWPNVVHEALGCGTPAVATNVGGVPDMIPSEEYGFVVPAGDDSALEQALGRAVRKTWNRKAIATWGQTRSWDNVAFEVNEEFERLFKEWKENKA